VDKPEQAEVDPAVKGLLGFVQKWRGRPPL